MTRDVRIAVCLYGQTRTAEYCAPWIKKSFDIPNGTEMNIFSKTFDCYHTFLGKEPCNFHVDYFLHFKDYNIYVNTKGDPDFLDAKPIKIDKAATARLIAAYKPKRWEQLSYDNERNIIDGNKNTYATMFYSIASALRLKKEYEMETGIPYDYCFVHRFDTINGPFVTSFQDKVATSGFMPLTVYGSSETLRWKWENWRLGPNDIFFGGDNLAVDMLLADISRLYSSDDQVMLGDDIGGPNIIIGRSAANSAVSLACDHSIIPAVVRHSADLLNNPVFDSWQYHQNFWLSNHKSTEL